MPSIFQIIIGGILGGFIGMYGVDRLFSHQWSIPEVLLFLFSIFASTFVSINIYEFGHFLFGKIFGYKLLSYRIGYLAWNYENGKMKFSFIKNKGYSGLCAMLPPTKELPIYKHILYYSGGIILNVITGIICILIGLLAFSSTFYQSVFILMGSIAVLLGLTNFIPFISGNNPTDGKIIWGLLLKKPFVNQLVELNKLMAQVSAGTRPKDLQLNNPNTENPNVYDLMTIVYMYYKALDKDELAEMTTYSKLLETYIDQFPPQNLPGIYYELCFMGSIMGDIDKAKKYYEKASKILLKDKDVNGQRVKAYYEYYVKKNKSKTIEFCDQALQVVHKFPIKGLAIMEEKLVRKLQEVFINMS